MSDNHVVGEFTVGAFTLVNQYQESLEITDMVAGFKLYESIFEYFVTGEVSVVDGLNLPKNFRLTGQEYLRISLKQKEGMGEDAEEDFSIDKTFRIYALENVIRANETTQSYVLRLCDPRMFYVQRKRISQTLRGRYDQILQNTLVDVGKFRVDEFDAWEQTVPENKQLICPNWTIHQLMEYLVNNSQVSESHAYKNSMFFYQTLNGGFRLQSFDNMCDMEFPVTFSNIPRNANLDTDEENLNSPHGLNTGILVYKKPQMFDTLTATIGGAYSSTQKVYDPIRKLEEETIYDLESAMKKGQHVSGHPMLYVDDMERVLSAEDVVDATVSPLVNEIDVDIQPTKEYGAVIRHDYQSNHPFDNATTLEDPEVFEGRKLNDSGQLERIALLNILQQHRIQVTIPLRTDLTVGMIIKFVMTTPETMGEGDKSDKVNDDRYLITDLALDGDLSSKTGTLTMECVKESYAEKIEDAKPLEEVSGVDKD